VLDPLNNNDLIKHGVNTLFLESSMKGLRFNIQDMLDGNRVIRLNEYRHRFGKYPGYFLDYFTIFNAFRSFRVADIVHDRKFYFKGNVAGKIAMDISIITKVIFKKIQKKWTPLNIKMEF